MRGDIRVGGISDYVGYQPIYPKGEDVLEK